MSRVVALYRHPIKGLTPQSMRQLTMTADGRVQGDRVLAFRFPRGARPQDKEGLDHWPKGDGLCLRDFPTLARLRLTYTGTRIRLDTEDGLLVEADALTQRDEIAAAVVGFLRGTSDADRIKRPENSPVTLVGDGVTARFQDRARGYVSLHSRASLAALDAATGARLDERRFRSNVAVEGLSAWDENELVGHTVRIGEVTCHVHAPIGRCLATHANPDTGVRDSAVLSTLTGQLGLERPEFGLLLVPDPGQEGARIGLGDELVDLGPRRGGTAA